MGNREGFLKENLLNSCVNFSNKRKMILKRALVMSMIINPYRQIPETISKKPAVNQGISRKLFPDFFQILQFWGVNQGIFRKLFPGKFHEYLPMKKYFFPKTGRDSEAFPETFSNIWKKVPENPLSHSPKVCLYGLTDGPLRTCFDL